MGRRGSPRSGSDRGRVMNARLYDALFPAQTTPARPENGLPLTTRLDPPPTDALPDAGEEALIAAARGKRLLSWQCRILLEILERACPGLIPPGPVPKGEATEPIDVETKHLEDLVLSALGVEDKRRRNQVIWEHAGSELLVHLKTARVAVLDGYVLIGVIVETVECDRVEITVPFAVGHPERLAGMVVTTEPTPRGPTLIIDRWGDALIAWAWQLLNDVIGALTARVGVDTEGVPLLPGATVASKGSLRVIPQAQHVFEVRRS